MRTLLLLAGLLLLFVGDSALAYPVTAYFTGRQQNVTTMSGQFGVRCQYQYLNNYFWKTFTGGICPMNVEVE